VRNGVLSDDNDNCDGRIDWDPADKDIVFARYAYSNRARFIPGYFGGIADGTSTSAWGRQKLQAYSGVVGWTRAFTPRLTNDFRAGYSHNCPAGPVRTELTSQYVPACLYPAVNGGVSLTQFCKLDLHWIAGFSAEVTIHSAVSMVGFDVSPNA
jgi:hypothetical protein